MADNREDEIREEDILRDSGGGLLSWIRTTSMRTKVVATGIGYFSFILILSSTFIPLFRTQLVMLDLVSVQGEGTNETQIEGWEYPLYDLPMRERPSIPPLWHERGYGFINQTFTFWVYYTADFSRINQRIVVEILNQSVETINVTVPYGDVEINRPEEIRGWLDEDDINVKVSQTANETIISIPVTPEMNISRQFEIELQYRILDLPGYLGVQDFDESYHGNQRWEIGNRIKFSPGIFDGGTWKLIVELVPNSDEIVPSTWESLEGRQITYRHGTQTTEGYEEFSWIGVGWAYLSEVPQNPIFNATFQYPS